MEAFKDYIDIFQILATIFTMGFVPLMVKKMDKHYKTDNERQSKLLEVQSAEHELLRLERDMSRETAQAVLLGKSNGELTAAIKAYDEAKERLLQEKDKAIAILKNL